MELDIEEKSSRRILVGKGVRLLRERLGVSQERLAGMIGTAVTSATVSRWERGALMPQPDNRDKLARIAKKNGMEHVAALFLESGGDWLSAASFNAPNAYAQMMAFDVLALNAFLFECPEEAQHYSRFRELMGQVRGFYDRLLELNCAGEEIFIPPSVHHRHFWIESLEQRRSDGKKTKGAR